jgi:hypothetical protein
VVAGPGLNPIADIQFRALQQSTWWSRRSITGHVEEEDCIAAGFGGVRARATLNAWPKPRRYAPWHFKCGPGWRQGRRELEAKQQGNLEFELHRAP